MKEKITIILWIITALCVWTALLIWFITSVGMVVWFEFWYGEQAFWLIFLWIFFWIPLMVMCEGEELEKGELLK